MKKEKLWQLKDEYLKEKVDCAGAEPKKSTIDFVLRMFLKWLEEKGEFENEK
jgi:hypothetical protein